MYAEEVGGWGTSKVYSYCIFLSILLFKSVQGGWVDPKSGDFGHWFTAIQVDVYVVFVEFFYLFCAYLFVFLSHPCQ